MGLKFEMKIIIKKDMFKHKNSNHYQFNSDLKRYSRMHFPLNPTFVSFVQKPMSLLYKLEHDDKYVHVIKTTAPISETSILGQPFSPTSSKNQVRVLIYEPKNCNEILPCIYFIHGGGFVFNAAPHHFSLVRKFTKELRVKTVLVDYRLAPKYKFPTALDDCLNVYKWLISNANDLRIDNKKIVVAGDSAGGNLAVGISIATKNLGITMPNAQMLLYPVLDRRMKTTSYKIYTNTPMSSSRDMEKYYKMYVGDKYNIPNSLIQYLSPMEAPSFEGIPPTYIEVTQYDCLHDEGVQFAQSLEKYGIPVELHEIKNAMHGYDISKDSNFMNCIMTLRIKYLQHLLSNF